MYNVWEEESESAQHSNVEGVKNPGSNSHNTPSLTTKTLITIINIEMAL
jgi:hypothetical protein